MFMYRQSTTFTEQAAVKTKFSHARTKPSRKERPILPFAGVRLVSAATMSRVHTTIIVGAVFMVGIVTAL